MENERQMEETDEDGLSTRRVPQTKHRGDRQLRGEEEVRLHLEQQAASEQAEGGEGDRRSLRHPAMHTACLYYYHRISTEPNARQRLNIFSVE